MTHAMPTMQKLIDISSNTLTYDDVVTEDVLIQLRQALLHAQAQAATGITSGVTTTSSSSADDDGAVDRKVNDPPIFVYSRTKPTPNVPPTQHSPPSTAGGLAPQPQPGPPPRPRPGPPRLLHRAR